MKMEKSSCYTSAEEQTCEQESGVMNLSLIVSKQTAPDETECLKSMMIKPFRGTLCVRT